MAKSLYLLSTLNINLKLEYILKLLMTVVISNEYRNLTKSYFLGMCTYANRNWLLLWSYILLICILKLHKFSLLCLRINICHLKITANLIIIKHVEKTAIKNRNCWFFTSIWEELFSLFHKWYACKCTKVRNLFP